MLFIIESTGEIAYSLSQLHVRLGIEFIDDVIMTIDSEIVSNYSEPCIIITGDTNGLDIDLNDKDTLLIKTDIINLIVSRYSMTHEKDTLCDDLERVSYNQSRGVSGSDNKPVIDLEILKIRKRIKSYMDDYGLQYNIKPHPAEGVLCLTHDVDSIKGKSLLRYFYWIVRYGPIRSFSMIIKTIKSKYDQF